MDVNMQTPGLMIVNLKPREIFFSERGAMAFMDSGIEMQPVDLGLVNGIKRLLAGESFLSMVRYENKNTVNCTLKLRFDIQNNGWFQSNVTNTQIEVLKLNEFQEDLIINSGAFFAGTGLSVDFLFDKNISRSLFGSGTIFNQRIRGNGVLFIKKNRWMILDAVHVNNNASIKIDPKEIYAFPFSALVKSKASISNLLAGEGLSSYEFKGPAKILVYKTNPQGNGDNSFNASKGCVTRILVAITVFIIYRLILSIIF